MAHDAALVSALLGEAKSLVLSELGRLVADRRRLGYAPLYEQLAIYPFREGKGLRPGIVLSACRAVGGRTDQAITSATAVELFHNAFLVHDDIEDGSEFRRGLLTLPEEIGIPAAINIGDASNVLAIGLLLENVEVLGVRKALLVFREIERMARESVEGQAIELEWIRLRRFGLSDDDYVRMAYKKTCWYTVIAPLRMGVIAGSRPGVGGSTDDELRPLVGLGFLAGIAFQIQDDVLNLEGDVDLYGKEIAGDLWEGKRTVMLNHFMRSAAPDGRDRALRLMLLDRRQKEKNRVEKLLEDACIKLSVVASDIFGVSGRDMLAALIAGERDPKRLAQLARRPDACQDQPAGGGLHRAFHRPPRVPAGKDAGPDRRDQPRHCRAGGQDRRGHRPFRRGGDPTR